MGAGTITMPYIVSLTGIGLGMILIVAGAFANAYASSLLVYCAEKTGKKTYEDFAEAAFRTKNARSVISCFSIVALLGFTTAYISLAKTLIPSIIVASIGDLTEFKY